MNFRAVRSAALLVASVALTACGDNGTGFTDVVDTGRADAVIDRVDVSMDSIGSDAPDVRSNPDAADANATADAGPAVPICQGCTANAECGPRGVCAQLNSTTRVCLESCNPDVPTCSHAFSCVMNFTLATVPVCTPVGGPCCIDADGDGYGSGVGCTASDCNDADPATHGAAETCNGVDDDCNGMVDDGLGSTMCGSGACMHTVPNCVGGVAQTCSPTGGTTETCNGVDDNCNGMVDEGLGSTTCGMGACQRTVSNCDSGVMQSCVPGTPATNDTCGNGIDDNCNGSVDEGCATCSPTATVWNIPPGTTGGPSCITTGGGTCSDTVSCSGGSCYGSNTCGQPHCGTLRCNDGTYVMAEYCTVIGSCTSSGSIVATGFTW